ncbi:hypothetical protein TYRP_020944 [Tyrophagus putrescentiae]|nr:hypothetical protein TYRP_020944 [Tyrophagus putrescentiae]
MPIAQVVVVAVHRRVVLVEEVLLVVVVVVVFIAHAHNVLNVRYKGLQVEEAAQVAWVEIGGGADRHVGGVVAGAEAARVEDHAVQLVLQLTTFITFFLIFLFRRLVELRIGHLVEAASVGGQTEPFREADGGAQLVGIGGAAGEAAAAAATATKGVRLEALQVDDKNGRREGNQLRANGLRVDLLRLLIITRVFISSHLLLLGRSSRRRTAITEVLVDAVQRLRLDEGLKEAAQVAIICLAPVGDLLKGQLVEFGAKGRVDVRQQGGGGHRPSTTTNARVSRTTTTTSTGGHRLIAVVVVVAVLGGQLRPVHRHHVVLLFASVDDVELLLLLISISIIRGGGGGQGNVRVEQRLNRQVTVEKLLLGDKGGRVGAPVDAVVSAVEGATAAAHSADVHSVVIRDPDQSIVVQGRVGGQRHRVSVSAEQLLIVIVVVQVAGDNVHGDLVQVITAPAAAPVNLGSLAAAAAPIAIFIQGTTTVGGGGHSCGGGGSSRRRHHQAATVQQLRAAHAAVDGARRVLVVLFLLLFNFLLITATLEAVIAVVIIIIRGGPLKTNFQSEWSCCCSWAAWSRATCRACRFAAFFAARLSLRSLGVIVRLPASSSSARRHVLLILAAVLANILLSLAVAALVLLVLVALVAAVAVSAATTGSSGHHRSVRLAGVLFEGGGELSTTATANVVILRRRIQRQRQVHKGLKGEGAVVALGATDAAQQLSAEDRVHHGVVGGNLEALRQLLLGRRRMAAVLDAQRLREDLLLPVRLELLHRGEQRDEQLLGVLLREAHKLGVLAANFAQEDAGVDLPLQIDKGSDEGMRLGQRRPAAVRSEVGLNRGGGVRIHLLLLLGSIAIARLVLAFDVLSFFLLFFFRSTDHLEVHRLRLPGVLRIGALRQLSSQDIGLPQHLHHRVEVAGAAQVAEAAGHQAERRQLTTAAIVVISQRKVGHLRGQLLDITRLVLRLAFLLGGLLRGLFRHQPTARVPTLESGALGAR